MDVFLYLVGYEEEPFSALWSNLLRWCGLWPFVFPQEVWRWHVVMLTEEEYAVDPPPLSASFSERAYWQIFNVGTHRPGDNRPGCCQQPLTDGPPWVFWHEFGEWLGSHVLDYDTEHFDRKAHCDAAEPLAGACPQLACRGPEVSSHCVKCRAGMQKKTGLVANIRQTPGEYQWFQANFTRPVWWPYADLNAQMAEVSGYNYSQYPVDRILGKRLEWFLTQPIKEPTEKTYLVLERILGGDGLPSKILTFEDPEVVFEPYSLAVKRRGFRRVEPDPAVAGDEVTVTLWTVENGVETPRVGTKVFVAGVLVGSTDAHGRLVFTV